MIFIICLGVVLVGIWIYAEMSGKEAGVKEAAEENINQLFGEGCACYEKGKFQAAVSWYFKAANLGHSGAMNNLAVCFADGNGVEENQKIAFDWFKSAAEAGNAQGMFNLSRRYELGIGTECDLRMARIWCEKAAEAGSADAKEKIAQMHDRMWADQAARQEYPSDQIPF